MLDIILCILTTTMLIVVFKLLERFHIRTFPTIVFNYWVCVLMGVAGSGALPQVGVIAGKPWFPLALFMGLMFIVVFNLIGASTRKAGITVTAIANKMSLVIPIAAAFVLYGDQATPLKIGGIALALISILLTTYTPPEGRVKGVSLWAMYLLPAGVFVGSGVVDTLVNFAQNRHLKGVSYEEFLIFLFLTAAVLGTIGLVVQLIRGREQVTWRTLVAGIALGAPNYGSLYFMLRALEFSGMESSTVFPMLNIGVVSLSSLVAYFAFKEYLSKLDMAGIILAIIAIVMLSFVAQ